MSKLDDSRKKLLYRATYRGFKEADLLIGGFARAHIAKMSDTELDEFEKLLAQNDRELYAWATNKTPPPEGMSGPVLDMLRKFKLTS